MTDTQTPQQRMKTKLETLGIPFKQIDVFGSQIIVTAWSETAARKWYSVLCKFTTSKRPVKSIDYNKENRGTCLTATVHEVWRIGGTINV
jgi:hypothetical protein